MISWLGVWWHRHQEERKQRLRVQNAKLRAAGKDPLKGWGKVVDSGFGGINTKAQNAQGQVDLTGGNLGTFNFYSEEQKRIASENEHKHRN